MRLGLFFVAAGLALPACSGGDDFTDGGGDTPTVTSVTPDYGPLSGGTRVVITGNGFLLGDAPPNRVVIGGREAPLAGAINDETLEVVIPEADSPGPVDVVVFNSNGFIEAPGAFRYSTPPEITDVTPGQIIFDTVDATMTITGTGFLDEEAGPSTVLVDGVIPADVQVVSDTTITFTAYPGPPMHEPDVQVINKRGEALDPRAYRYAPVQGEGLLLFPIGSTTIFAIAYDPATDTRVDIPRRRGGPSGAAMISVTRATDGTYWGHDRNTREYGRIDFGSQELADPVVFPDRRPEFFRSGDTVYVFDRNNMFGELDVETGSIDAIGTGNVVCCGSFGIATNAAGTMFVNETDGISTMNPVTGIRGPIVPLTPNEHVSGMRFLDGTLYATTRNGTLITIDPTTGVTAVVESFGVGLSAIELLN